MFVVGGTNHNLQRKCKNGWNIPVKYIYHVSKVEKEKLSKNNWNNKIALDKSDQADSNKNDFQNCLGRFVNYKFFIGVQNVDWGLKKSE